MSTKRMFFCPKKMNDILAGKGDIRGKVASVLTKTVDADGREVEQWESVYLATDQKTGKPRHSRKGDLILNLKAQRAREEFTPIIDPEADNYDDAWSE